LNPQAGQRQTACMRYISAPQRSHSILSALDAVASDGEEIFRGVIGRGTRSGESDMRRL
jgi:hypothetical protein